MLMSSKRTSSFGFAGPGYRYRPPVEEADELVVETTPPPKPLRDRVKHTREDGIETLSYAWRSPGKRRIRGIASTPTITSRGAVVSSRGCMARLPIPLRYGHSKLGRGIGEVTLVRKSDRQIYIEAEIFDTPAGDHAWRLIESGALRCLSVGKADVRYQAEVDGVRYVDQWKLAEVSICRKGANADCFFQVK